MNTEDIKRFIDRDIKVKTTSGYVYQTQNLEIIDNQTVGFTDKFGNELILSTDEITLIISKGEKNGKL